LSYYLAKVLKHFNQNNKLVCVTDLMEDNCENIWFDKILASDAGEIVELMTTEYDSIFLPKDFFDIVIINGSVIYTEPAEVIQNAINFIKKEGLLICGSNSQYLLNSCFQVAFDNCTEYAINDLLSVFSKVIGKEEKMFSYQQTDEFKCCVYKENIVKVLSALKGPIEDLEKSTSSSANSKAEIDEKIKCLSKAEDDILAIYSQLNSLEIKYKISELKEALINYRLFGSNSESAYYAEVCRQKYQSVISEMKNCSDFEI